MNFSGSLSSQGDLNRYRLALNLTGAFGCLLLGSAFWVGIETTFQSQHSALQTSLEEQRQLLSQSNGLTERLGVLQREESRLQVELVETQQRIPQQADEVQFLQQIAQHAEDSGVQIREFLPGGVQTTGNQSRTQIRLTALTSYHGFCQFLFKMRQMERLYDVDECSLKSVNPNSDEQSLTMALSIFHAFPGSIAAANAERRN